jgi:hypothetical protein
MSREMSHRTSRRSGLVVATAMVSLACLSTDAFAGGSLVHVGRVVGINFAATQAAPSPRQRPPEKPPSNSNTFHQFVGRVYCAECGLR